MPSAPSPWAPYARAGGLAALLALALAHAYHLAYVAAGAPAFPEVHVPGITVAASLPVLLAGLAYRAFDRLGPAGRVAYVVGGLALTLLSIVPVLVAPPHPGFAWLAVPLHLLVGGVASMAVPAYAAGAALSPPPATPAPHSTTGPQA